MPPRIAAEFTANHLAIVEGRQVEAVLPENIDTEAEELAEACRISLRAANEVLEWFKHRERDEIHRHASDLLKRFISEVVPLEGRIKPQVVGLRVLGLDFLLNRRAETLTALAERAGTSKQLLDHHTHWVGDKFAFRGFAQKSQQARAAFAEAQRQSWGKLSPEERKARRAGKSAQSLNNDQI